MNNRKRMMEKYKRMQTSKQARIERCLKWFQKRINKIVGYCIYGHK